MRRVNLPNLELIGTYRTLYYDLASHRIELKPAPEVDEVMLYPEKSKRIFGESLIFKAVSDISISSADNIVIGRCISFVVENAGDRQQCRMIFDDFDAEISVSFTFSSLNVDACS